MATKFKLYVIRPVRDFFIYNILHSIFGLGCILNRKVLLWWHGIIAIFLFKMTKKTRIAVIKNLEIAFGPSDDPKKYYNMGIELYDCLGKTFTDYAIFAKLKTREEFSKYFTFEGEENLKNAYQRGKGVLCMVTHTPGWEFSAIMPPILGYKTIGVSSKIKNPALDKLMIEMRESRGMKNITRDHCFQALKEELSKGKCLIIMIDQDSMNIRGEFLQFFEKDAYTPIGCARLIQDTGAALVPMFTIRDMKTDSYTFKMMPEIPFEEKDTEIETFRSFTQKCNDFIESQIRKYPSQWVWMHNRWKTTPKSLEQFLKNRSKLSHK